MPGQRQDMPKNSDWTGHHVAFYVTDIDDAVESINYFRTPFGTNVELISYPHGMAYEESAAIPLWDPRDNHP